MLLANIALQNLRQQEAKNVWIYACYRQRSNSHQLSAYNSSQQCMNSTLLSITCAYDVLGKGEGRTTNRIWYV